MGELYTTFKNKELIFGISIKGDSFLPEIQLFNHCIIKYYTTHYLVMIGKKHQSKIRKYMLVLQ